MREVKFRIWDKENLEILGWDIIEGEGTFEWLNDFTFNVMQYTGLKDMDERDVYEGDLFKDGDGRIFEMKFGEYTRIIGLGAFKRMRIGGYGWYLKKVNSKDVVASTECQYVEMIGNIYENPELIGGVK